MSDNKHTTASAGAATFDPFAFAERIEDLQMMARATTIVTETAIDDALNGQGLVAITRYEADLISSLVYDVRRKTEEACEVFALGHGAGHDGHTDARPNGEGVDPLLAIVREYEAGLATFNALPDTLTDAELDQFRDVTWKPPRSILTGDAVPRPTTMEGVVAALRCLVREHDECGGDGKLDRAVLPAILAFLDPPKPLTVPEAIDRHRAAFAALGPLFEAESTNSTDETRAAVEAGEDREQEAKTALMRARPADMREEADRLEYLFSQIGPWSAFAPTAEDGADLVASMRAA